MANQDPDTWDPRHPHPHPRTPINLKQSFILGNASIASPPSWPLPPAMARPWIDHHWARRSGIYSCLPRLVLRRSRFPLAQPSSSRSLLSKAGFPDPLVLSTPLPHRHPPSPLPAATCDGHPPPGHLEAFSTLCLCSGQATLLPAASTHQLRATWP